MDCSLRGASGRHSARGKGHEEGGSTYAKAGSSLRSPPGNPRASTPIIRACLLYYFVLSPTPLTLRGSLCPKVYPLCLHLLCCPANRIISEVPVSVGKAQQDRVNVIRLASLGASLVVQWLNPMLLTQGAWVRSLVRKLDPSCHI